MTTTTTIEHLGAEPLLAVAPTRDVLFVVDAAKRGAARDLGDVLDRLRDGDVDHRLTDDVYVWDGRAWEVLEPGCRPFARRTPASRRLKPSSARTRRG